MDAAAPLLPLQQAMPSMAAAAAPLPLPLPLQQQMMYPAALPLPPSTSWSGSTWALVVVSVLAVAFLAWALVAQFFMAPACPTCPPPTNNCSQCPPTTDCSKCPPPSGGGGGGGGGGGSGGGGSGGSGTDCSTCPPNCASCPPDCASCAPDCTQCKCPPQPPPCAVCRVPLSTTRPFSSNNGAPIGTMPLLSTYASPALGTTQPLLIAQPGDGAIYVTLWGVKGVAQPPTLPPSTLPLSNDGTTLAMPIYNTETEAWVPWSAAAPLGAAFVITWDGGYNVGVPLGTTGMNAWGHLALATAQGLQDVAPPF